MSTNDPNPHGPAWVTANIRMYGMVITAVGSGGCSEPGCDGEHPMTQPWSYTIGRVEAGEPELVTYGLSVETAHKLLTFVNGRSRCGDPIPLALPVVFAGRDIRLDRIPPWWVASADNPMGRWFAYYHGTGRLATNPDVLQVVWADEDGLFPDDTGCDPLVRLTQPILGNAPHPLPRRPSRPMPRTPGHATRRHPRRSA